MTNNTCKICGHPKKEHKGHIGPDHTGKKINHIGCRVVVKTEYIKDFLGKGNIMPVGHTCSCDGFKKNTSLKRAIRRYKKFLKTETDPSLVKDMYVRKQVLDAIKRFRKMIRDNPQNLLYWQIAEQNQQELASC